MFETFKNTSFSKMLSELNQNNDEIGLAVSATKFAYSLGFEWLTYCTTKPSKRIFSTYPKHWREQYSAKEYDTVDPICELDLSQGRVIPWSLPSSGLLASTQKGSDFLKDANTVGICSGITLQLTESTDKYSAITLSSPKAISNWSSQLQTIEECVVTWAKEFESCITNNLSEFTERRTLTNRQRECLTYAAQGMTAKMIALEKGLSPRTVEFHLEEAKKRLGVSTIHQATAIGIKDNILAL